MDGTINPSQPSLDPESLYKGVSHAGDEIVEDAIEAAEDTAQDVKGAAKDVVTLFTDTTRKGDGGGADAGAGGGQGNKLAYLHADDPNPTPPDRDVGESPPPEGPTGKGNPWFNANPLVTYRLAFLELVRVMSRTKLVEMNVGITEMNQIYELAKTKSKIIKARAEAEAIKHFINAGIQLAGMAVMFGGAAKAAKSATAKTTAGSKLEGAEAKEAARAAREAAQTESQMWMHGAQMGTQMFTSINEGVFALIKGGYDAQEVLVDAEQQIAKRNMDSAFEQIRLNDELINKAIQTLDAMTKANFQSFGSFYGR